MNNRTYQSLEKPRIKFIENDIIGALPEEERTTNFRKFIKHRISETVENYRGFDVHTLILLSNASKKRRLYESLEKFEDYYRKNEDRFDSGVIRLSDIDAELMYYIRRELE
jgi:hypothetical protein